MASGREEQGGGDGKEPSARVLNLWRVERLHRHPSQWDSKPERESAQNSDTKIPGVFDSAREMVFPSLMTTLPTLLSSCAQIWLGAQLMTNTPAAAYPPCSRLRQLRMSLTRSTGTRSCAGVRLLSG
jgi:hypothetical protein